MDTERSPVVIPCSSLGFEQEGEGHVECGDREQLQEGVQPEEFVAIADYSATDQTQVTLHTCLQAGASGLGSMFYGFG